MVVHKFQLLILVQNCAVGRFLADVYEALEDAGCSITLRTNHRSESQFIVDNAERILQQKLPIINPRRHFHQINLNGNRGSEDNSKIAYPEFHQLQFENITLCESESVLYALLMPCKP